MRSGSFKKSIKQDTFSGLTKKCMRSLSHCTCCFLCLEILFSTPYSLPYSVTFLLRCPHLQEVLWLPRLWLAASPRGSSHCASPSAQVGMIWDILGCPLSSMGRVLSSWKDISEYASKGKQVTLFSSLSPSNWDSCPALGTKALAASSMCPWEEKAVEQWAS